MPDAACGMSFFEPYLTAREVRIDAMDAREKCRRGKIPYLKNSENSINKSLFCTEFARLFDKTYQL